MPFLALPFPAIDPVLVEFGPFAIRWYALAYIAGILLAWRLMRREVADERLWNGMARPQPVDIDDFVLWATLGIILGGRLGYVLFYDPVYFLNNPTDVLKVWTGGMSFHGGFLGTVLAMVLFARMRGLSVLTFFDLAGTVAPIGLFFGRIANFINGELWGRPSDVPWAIAFPTGGPEPRHPSQLYEAALEGVVLFLLIRLAVTRFSTLQRPGLTAGLFAAGYGAARTIAEFFRMPDVQIGYLYGGLTMGMLLSAPMILAGLALALWAVRRKPASGPNPS
ncbi:prolipoprotein diacylglyceryl transferase [Stappia sp. F7233]|uniref:Phosphatidylglycerol--prolipoprotein diacylglyceryl transferase n=1 Tax=Stappia albiluteola TaxID=2758565 RepID=A0A839AAI0_9HYPH|nr:prolipoprotein diacylglyceryl transferase [Stappia albiluteola]MBA5775759.1 prolipoprotein diacylglyceryl transferase [Stappia albiluteola]